MHPSTRSGGSRFVFSLSTLLMLLILFSFFFTLVTFYDDIDERELLVRSTLQVFAHDEYYISIESESGGWIIMLELISKLINQVWEKFVGSYLFFLPDEVQNAGWNLIFSFNHSRNYITTVFKLVLMISIVVFLYKIGSFLVRSGRFPIVHKFFLVLVCMLLPFYSSLDGIANFVKDVVFFTRHNPSAAEKTIRTLGYALLNQKDVPLYQDQLFSMAETGPSISYGSNPYLEGRPIFQMKENRIDIFVGSRLRDMDQAPAPSLSGKIGIEDFSQLDENQRTERLIAQLNENKDTLVKLAYDIYMEHAGYSPAFYKQYAESLELTVDMAVAK